MIKHLRTVNISPTSEEAELTPLFFVKLSNEKSKTKNTIYLNRSYIELALNSNGKAELYFHAYMWTAYIEKVAEMCGKQNDAILADPEILRMHSLSTKP